MFDDLLMGCLFIGTCNYGIRVRVRVRVQKKLTPKPSHKITPAQESNKHNPTLLPTLKKGGREVRMG